MTTIQIIGALVIVLAFVYLGLQIHYRNKRIKNRDEIIKKCHNWQNSHLLEMDELKCKYEDMLKEKNNMLLWARFHGENGKMIAEGTEHWVNGIPMSEEVYQRHLENENHPIKSNIIPICDKARGTT